MSLERAIQICQARDVTQHRLKSMEGSTVTSEAECKIETVMNSQTIMQAKRAPKGGVSREQQPRTCGNCGGEHRPRQFPAFGKECQLCGMRNHFARVCRQWRPRERNSKVNLVRGSDVALDEEDTEDLFMGSIERSASDVEEWTETYNINGTDIKFRVDTGAQANLLAETELPNLQVKPQIKKETKTRLRAYNWEIIPNIGKCNLLLRDGDKTYELEFTITNQ